MALQGKYAQWKRRLHLAPNIMPGITLYKTAYMRLMIQVITRFLRYAAILPSEADFVWTLRESFEFSLRGNFDYAFFEDVPINENDPPISRTSLVTEHHGTHPFLRNPLKSYL